MEYFEDVTVGDAATVGEYEVTAAEIVEFAEGYDPQSIHTDEEAAADSPFGGLIASGWHTAAMTMRLLVDDYYADRAALAATGVDELRFLEPVRPGDTLTAEIEVRETEPWDDDRGLVRSAVRTTAGDETVLTMEPLVLWRRAGD
ncbi:MaoC family dehydratase [Halomicrobium urmianum]|uniref:MaoC family dehydratase n=1 Tax=Halomicrobium urmianum TaxID=1586233 RepID=UPI001CDA2B01|nr:MaoC family dehydratase [Halomicrobium urmianum]